MAFEPQQCIFSVTFNCVFLPSPPSHKSLLTGGHLDCLNARRKLPSHKRERETEKRKLPLIPGATDIFCRRPSTASEKPARRAPRRYIELKDFQIEKSFRSVMHLNKGMEFRGGYYCRRAQPPSNQQQKGWRVEVGGWGGGSVLPPPWSHGVV